MGPALQVIGLIAGFAGMSAAQDQAAKAEQASREAAAAQKQAIAARESQAKLAERRERRKAIRQRIRTTAELRAQIDAAGAGGSLVGGAISSVASQTGANLGFSTQMSGLGSQFSAASARAADANMMAGIYQSRSQAAGAMSGMGFKLFSSFGGTDIQGGGSIFSGLFPTA